MATSKLPIGVYVVLCLKAARVVRRARANAGNGATVLVFCVLLMCGHVEAGLYFDVFACYAGARVVRRARPNDGCVRDALKMLAT